MSTEAAKLEKHVVMSPDGKHVAVPKQLFDALREFLENQWSGTLVVDLRSGRVMSVRGETKKVYS